MKVLAVWAMRIRYEHEREGVTGEWIDVHNGELDNLYS
jgi:hypothetical protein